MLYKNIGVYFLKNLKPTGLLNKVCHTRAFEKASTYREKQLMYTIFYVEGSLYK